MEQFDCYDFCQWTLGKYYNFSGFDVPNVTLYLPEIEDLIYLHELFLERKYKYDFL